MLSVGKTKWHVLQKQWNSIDCGFKIFINDLDFSEVQNFINDLLFIEIDENIETYLLLNFLFSILTYADKTEVAIGYSKDTFFPKNIYNIIDEYKKNKFRDADNSELNNLREEIYNISEKSLIKNYKNNKIFSLNVPTGGGKTLTVLNLAFKLLEKDKSLKRIIYALPFTSIIDQAEKILKEIFANFELNAKEYLITHHHLAEVEIKYGENDFTGNKAQLLIENWDKPFILTTFWQLFNTLITNKNSLLRKFHNLANSVIILDEVQTIPYEYWDLTKTVFMKLVEIFNCRIIFLTATMPLIFREDKNEIFPLIKEKDKYFSKFCRYKVNILKTEQNNEIKKISLGELLSIAYNDIENNKDKSFLFVFNTIKASLDFFNLLKNSLNDNRELIYLSTNILPINRKKRIETIKNNPSNKIIISTQLIEAGVDIDLDIVYRDFAPIDSLIQTAGRCNRNNKKDYVGMIKFFKLINENNKPFFSFIYKGLQNIITTEIFKEKRYFFEKNLLDIINSYFKLVKKKQTTDSSSNLLMLIKNMNYEDIEDDFKLIEQIPSQLIFVEKNKNATEILEKFNSILKTKDKFERKNEFLKIKNDFYNYVLSLKLTKDNLSILNSFEEIGNFKLITLDMLDQFYKEDTGFSTNFDCFF